jgi:hypothetical protein
VAPRRLSVESCTSCAYQLQVPQGESRRSKGGVGGGVMDEEVGWETRVCMCVWGGGAEGACMHVCFT